MRNRNILIIGGSYFAGRVFTEVAHCHPEFSLHLFNRGHIPIGIDGVETFTGDRDDPDQIASAIPDKPWQAVIDFCAYRPEQIAILLNIIGHRVEHYILISTASVYVPGVAVSLDESAPVVDRPLPALGDFAEYAFNKALTEEILKMECLQRGITFTIFRPSIIYGRYNYAPREHLYFDLIRRRQPVIFPDTAPARFSFVWVEDMARILTAAVTAPETFGETFNIAAPEAVTYNDIAETLRQLSTYPFDLLRKTMAQITRAKVELPFPLDVDLLYDGSKIGRAIGFRYTPFQVGMTETWRHYMAHVLASNRSGQDRPEAGGHLL